MRILIADDSVVSRHMLDATLRRWGHDVVSAASGDEAWNILQQGDAPEIAIMDWMMPGMSGVEVCQRIRDRSSQPYIYIILLTSKNLREDVIAGMDAGADDYLFKPLDEQELRVRLRAGVRVIDLQAQLVAMREDLRVQATRDSLTKLWNRSSILEIFHRELVRSARESSSLGVVLLDLDHFKSINDTHGHFAGDEVLKETARRMESVVREYDSVGRYGGEEFLVLLPGCDYRTTSVQAERMRSYLASSVVLVKDVPLTITGSFGATCAQPSISASAEDLIRCADEALYRAKRLGRDRVEFLNMADHSCSIIN
ncbi:MAG TPA: diguanylate cyclase [Bryobacteraceae bacterium]|nr:diguanylate cyclase [Bryobacteraceae bacterium]